MKAFVTAFTSLLLSLVPAFAQVTVTSPSSGSTVSSPVLYTATAKTSCSKGVASMGVYVDNTLTYVVSGSSLNTSLAIASGKHGTVVEEWDKCGGASYTPVAITVSSGGGGGTPPPQPGVVVTSPANNSTVTSPVTYAATATTSCAKGVSSMGVYVDNKLIYVVQGSTLNTSLAVGAGKHGTVVEEWDGCGSASYTSLTITVGAAAATTVAMTASPTSITAGGSSTLSVSATNATGVTISGSDGTSYTLSATGGTQIVSPKTTTTYTATATGASGTATSSQTVTVTTAAQPAVSMTANPTSIAAGGTSTLSVTANNATTVTISGSDGTSYALSATGGTQSVSPTGTTTYTATATSSSGVKATASATVTIASAPTVSITANPTSITAGTSSTLTVAASNATGVTISGSDGSSYTLNATGGTQPVSPTATTTYTVTATGSAGTKSTNSVTVTVNAAAATVSLTANPTSITVGSSSLLTVAATNSTGVTITGTDGTSYTLSATGGTQSVSPTTTATYTATATANSGTNPVATVTVTVGAGGSVQSINHVIFMLQENHTFDNYFGMLNPYRQANGWDVGDDGKHYEVDGIDDKLTSFFNQDDEGTKYSPFKLKSTCIDDDSSDWLASYGAVNRYDFSATRLIQMDGFVHDAEGYAKSCAASKSCSGNFTDLTGQRAMGYYDQSFLNYYYYMASQFAVSNRWFSPMSSKSVSNRIATFTGGTTQGLVLDPGNQDKLSQLVIPTIFQELQAAKVTWKVYYSVTVGYCNAGTACGSSPSANYPATDFSSLNYSFIYLYENPTGAACTGTTQPSSVVGDTTNSFCIDPNHVAPLTTYFTDVKNGTLPSFAFIEAGYGNNDEHPGSGQSVLGGQYQVANIVNSLMNSQSWKDSVFFFSYDEGGGPLEHVPPVPGHSNDFTDSSLSSSIPDISSIAVNADSYGPCVPAGGVATTHCDLLSSYPGANPKDAAAIKGFSAQLGFRVPNIVISPFTRRHYVSNVPMDHTAIIKFVENRFIGSSAHLTARDAAQPNLLDFFDFSGAPWATPPTPPSPVTKLSLGYDPCNAASMGP